MTRPMRQTGKTTRAIDKTIQLFFEGANILIPTYDKIEELKLQHTLPRGTDDDYIIANIDGTMVITDADWFRGEVVQINLFNKIIDRLANEHRLIPEDIGEARENGFNLDVCKRR